MVFYAYVILLLGFMIKPFLLLEFSLKKNIIKSDLTLTGINSLLQYISYDLPTINLCFGTPKAQCFALAINLFSYYTVLEDSTSKSKWFNHQFNRSSSETFDTSQTRTAVGFPIFGTQNFRGNGDLCLDYINFPNEPHMSSPFCFILSKHSNKDAFFNIDGYIGLKKTHYELYSQISTNLLKYLFDIKQLKQRIFSLYYDSNGGGLITFDNHEIDNESYCNTTDYYAYDHEWSCNMTGVRFGNIRMAISNSRVEFDSIKNYMSVPKKDGMMIFDKIIQMTDGKCELKDDQLTTVLICHNDIDIGIIPDLCLEFNKTNFCIAWKHLLKKITLNNTYVYVSLLFLDNSMKLQFEDPQFVWKLGIPAFLDRTIIFDKDNLKISFIAYYTPYNPINFLLLALFIILLFGVVSSIIIQYKAKFIINIT